MNKRYLWILFLSTYLAASVVKSQENMQQGNQERSTYPPLEAVNVHVFGAHWGGSFCHQMAVHHYCSQANANITQCILYDGNQSDARLVGIEYIISPEAFASLPEEEKHYYHSHVYEVKSGLLVAPDVTPEQDYAIMEMLIGTYGKTIQLWATDLGDAYPIGSPKLMWALINDEMVLDSTIQDRDSCCSLAIEEAVNDRANISEPQVLEGADWWTSGQISIVGTITTDFVQSTVDQCPQNNSQNMATDNTQSGSQNQQITQNGGQS